MSTVLTLAQRTLRGMQVLQLYLWFAMSLLLIQGGGSLALRLSPALEAVTPLPLATLMNGNVPHAILHTVWGLIGLTILFMQRSERATLGLGLVFGTFYTLLGILGIFVENPFGLRLAWQENLFHLTVGPLMLVLVALAWRAPAMIVWGKPTK